MYSHDCYHDYVKITSCKLVLASCQRDTPADSQVQNLIKRQSIRRAEWIVIGKKVESLTELNEKTFAAACLCLFSNYTVMNAKHKEGGVELSVPVSRSRIM